MTAPRIFKYTVPVDDQQHVIDLRGSILHVGSQRIDEVQFWAMHDDDMEPVSATFQVVGTGQPFPDGLAYVGTAPSGPFVWHLLMRGL